MRLRMHDSEREKEVCVRGELRGIQPELWHFLSVHMDTNSGWMTPSGQSGSQERSRRLKQDSRLWCWLCSVVTAVERDGELDCCSAQCSSASFSLAAETAALPWFGHRTGTHATHLFLIKVWYQRQAKQKQLSEEERLVLNNTTQTFLKSTF